jgi:hypothetical protein
MIAFELAMIPLAVTVASPGPMVIAALDVAVPAISVPTPATGITALRMAFELAKIPLAVAVASPGLTVISDMATMLPARIVPAVGTGITVERIVFELVRMLLIVVAGVAALNPWSFLDPLRPVLFWLPLMAVAIKAAMAKHATTILMGVARVIMERRNSNSFVKDMRRGCWVKYEEFASRKI